MTRRRTVRGMDMGESEGKLFWEEDKEPELLPEAHEDIPYRLLEMTA